MNPQVKQAWTNALTSGRFRQAEGQLKEIDSGRAKHCCLGVLCQLFSEQVEGAPKFDGESFEGNDMMPPKSVYKWSGLTEKQASYLASMNDGDVEINGEYNCQSFKKIADFILTGEFEKLGKKAKAKTKTVRWANQYGSGVKRVRI